MSLGRSQCSDPVRVKDDVDGRKDSPDDENLFGAADRLGSRSNIRRKTMGYAVVRYGVKNADLEENRALIAKVFEELDRSVPPALQYLAIELDDGEFLHVVRDDNEASTLPQLAAFKAFLENHAERRSTAVMRSPATIIGNYRMIADGKPV
jgi:hypothetical protein